MTEQSILIAITAIISGAAGGGLAIWISAIYWTRWSDNVIRSLTGIIAESNKALDRNSRAFESFGEIKTALNELSITVRQFVPRAAKLDPRGKWTHKMNDIEWRYDEPEPD